MPLPSSAPSHGFIFVSSLGPQIIGYHNDVDYPVSRYAFRILASRETGRCWVYAGGFDSKGDLFLNPHTIRWGTPSQRVFLIFCFNPACHCF